MKNTIGYVVIILLLVIASVSSLNLFLKQRAQRDLLDIHKFPMQIGEWTATDLPITEKEYDILETKNLILREYANSKGDVITLFIIYSETNRSVFHPPEVCLIGSGLNIVNKTRETIEDGKWKIETNKMVLEKGQFKELALYSFKAADLYTHNYPLQQAYFAIHQLLGKRVKGATIRVSMPMRRDEKSTFITLKNFLTQVVDQIQHI